MTETDTTALPLVVTDAGREAAVTASNDGLQLKLTEIALGSALWQPDATATALQEEIKRLPNIGGSEVAPDMLHLSITDDSGDGYSLGEFGLYTDTGILFAIYSQSSWISEKVSESILMLSSDIKLDSVPPGSVTIEGNNFQYPPATESLQGVSEVATQEEVDEGTDGWRFLVPSKLKAWWDKVRVWENISDKPDTATRWPSFDEVTDKPDTYPPERIIGELAFFSTVTPPPGFFSLDGSTITNGAIDFPELATSGSYFITVAGSDIVLKDAPDFLRGKGSGDRVVGEFENDAIRNITGRIVVYTAYSGVNEADGVFSLENAGGSGESYAYASSRPGFAFDASSVVPTADQNRPKSLTALLCIYHGVLS